MLTEEGQGDQIIMYTRVNCGVLPTEYDCESMTTVLQHAEYQKYQEYRYLTAASCTKAN